MGWMARLLLLLVALAVGCQRQENEGDAVRVSRPYPPKPLPVSGELLDRPAIGRPSSSVAPNPDRNAYFGDLHVHTTWSMDAFSFGTTATPREAYRYARGGRLQHPAGFEMKLRTPLDFYAVTDHALFLGLAAEAADTSTTFSKNLVAEPLHDLNQSRSTSPLEALRRLRLFGGWIGRVLKGILSGTIDRYEVVRVKKTAWLDIIDAADEFYVPGEFTTLVGYEYTPSHPDGGSLHRNVFFRSSRRLPAEPFGRYNGRSPELLWAWMDGLRDHGIESLAIPHNSNGSNGQMFALADWAGDPLDDAYAARRMRNEPLVEITQIKGTSETHPSLSDTDEWAGFEIKPFIGSTTRISEPQGSYVRQALRDGLALEEAGVDNPFQFGFVAASDTHTGATQDDEADFHSKVGLIDHAPELRGSLPLPWWQAWPLSYFAPGLVTEVGGRTYTQAAVRTFGASGLAAVWAEENTREAIYDAFRRKETFATSGPRIRVRFFGGPSLDPSLAEAPHEVSRAYASGVPMGRLVLDAAEGLTFFAHGIRDPEGGTLQRLQIVKGWVDGEETFERVYDIACSDGGTVDPQTHRCPDNMADVDLRTCTPTPGLGSSELSAVWRDPEFEPAQRAFYYVRVLENPTCRWSTWDAVRAGLPPRPDLPPTLQERAWSSPIWYSPRDT